MQVLKRYLSLPPHIRKVTLPIHILAGLGFICSRFSNHLLEIQWSIVLLGWFLFSGLGIAIGFHRLLSHRSFRTWPTIEYALTILGSFACQGSSIFWKAVHMGSHHPHSDKDLDLHSPAKGFWHGYMGWQFSLRAEQVPFLAARDLLNNPVQLFLHRNYVTVLYLPILVLSLFSLNYAYSFFVLPMFLSMHVENIVNSFCHEPRFGYRSYSLPDRSCNIPILGYLFFGQGWHNNHHRHPGRANFGGQRWWEFDPSAPITYLIRR